MSRKFPRPVKRLVVKVGSSVVATYKLQKGSAHLRSLTKQISALNEKGTEVILVSSGAIVLGMSELNESTRPTDLASLQARAAIGQGVLMATYGGLFERSSTKCAWRSS